MSVSLQYVLHGADTFVEVRIIHAPDESFQSLSPFSYPVYTQRLPSHFRAHTYVSFMSDMFDGLHIWFAEHEDLYLPTQTHQVARAYSFILRGPECEHYCTHVLHLAPWPPHLLATETGSRRSRLRRSSFFIHVEIPSTMYQGDGVTVDLVPDRL